MPIAGGAGAEEHDPLAGQAALFAARGEHPGDDDRAGALDVVVEAGQPVAVAIEDAEGVVLLEVLPLDDGAPGKTRRDRLDERLDEPRRTPRRAGAGAR